MIVFKTKLLCMHNGVSSLPVLTLSLSNNNGPPANDTRYHLFCKGNWVKECDIAKNKECEKLKDLKIYRYHRNHLISNS